MRMKLASPAAGFATIEYDDIDLDRRVERTFYVSGQSGRETYIHESYTDALEDPQVCALLARNSGPALTASTETLAEVIRKEYRAMRAEERRQARQ